jgi:RNA polymerase sigma factor (sigma-70 family)
VFLSTNSHAFSLVQCKHGRLNAGMAINSTLIPATVSHGAEPANDSFEDLLYNVGQKQDRTAFIQLFNHFAPRIKSFLMKGGARSEQAEELAQETMLNVWTKAGGYDPKQANASTWIFTIARNKRIDALRKTGRVQYDTNDPAYIPDDVTQSADKTVLNTERMAKIADVLKNLPPEQADLIRKAYFEDKTHMEIAAETKIPLGTVKSRLRLALDRLRPQLGQEYL